MIARRFGFAVLTALVLGLPARAEDNNWTNSLGNFVWGNLNTDTNWSINPFFWDNQWDDTAIFTSTGVGSISAFGTLDVRGIYFQAGGYTINGGTLNLVNGGISQIHGISPGEIRVNSSATINSIIAGSVGLTKTGAGMLTLVNNNGPNTYTGGTNVNAGTLQVGNGGVTGNLGSGTVTIANSADLIYYRSGSVTISNNHAGAGGLLFPGINSIDQSSYSLTGNNSAFNGTIQVGGVGFGSRLVVSNGNQLGTAAVSVASGSGIYFPGGTYSNSFTIAGNGWSESAGVLGALRVENGAVLSGPIVMTANSRITTFFNSGGTISGVISGAFALEKTGSHTLVLSGVNTFTGGTTVNAGTLQLGNGTNPASLVSFRGADNSNGPGAPGGIAVTMSNATALTVLASATITGGRGGDSTALPQASNYSGGIGGTAVLFSAGGSLTNSGTVTGGSGGRGQPGIHAFPAGAGGVGGAGVSLSVGGAFANTGSISGGAGGPAGNPDASGGEGGSGVVFGISGSWTNGGTINGGGGGQGSPEAFFANNGRGGNGGWGVILNGSSSSFTNNGAISGGPGGPGVDGTHYGFGRHGVLFNASGSLTNTNSISGGSGQSGGVGAYFASTSSSLTNSGAITGGSGVSVSRSNRGVDGGEGVLFVLSGSVINSGTIIGGNGSNPGVEGGNGRSGIAFNAGGAVTNSGTITGGAAGTGYGGGGTPGVNGWGVSIAGAAGTFNNNSGGIINRGVTMGNFANSVTLETGSTINGELNIGNSTSATLTLTGSGTQVFSAAVTGTMTFAGSFTKSGNGTWTLDRVFTFTGGTTVNGGVLQLGNGATTAALVGFTGANGNPGSGASGGTATTVNNAATLNVLASAAITGGAGGNGSLSSINVYSGGNGATAVNFSLGGSLTNSGAITGGNGGVGGSGLAVAPGPGGSAGSAVTFSSGGSLNNLIGGTITGGNGGAGGGESGGFGAVGATGGAGVIFSSGSSWANSGSLSGGRGGDGGSSNKGANAGPGGAGVSFSVSGSWTNGGIINGGGGGNGGNGSIGSTDYGGNGGAGGTGVSFGGGGSFINSGTITGGAGGAGGTGFNPGFRGAGGTGVLFSAGGSLTNNNIINAGHGGGPIGGTGVYFTASGTVINTGAIKGGNGIGFGPSYGDDGGPGVRLNAGGSLTNNGTITGGNGANNSTFGGDGGSGVDFLSGGSLTNSGTISVGTGGSGSSPGSSSWAVSIDGAAGTLNNNSGGIINGGVAFWGNFANSATLETGSTINGALNITSTSATLTLTGTGTSLYSAAVTGSTIFSGALTKTGTGTWTLDRALGATGTTTVAQGTLIAAIANALPSSTALTIGQLASPSNGRFNTGGFAQTFFGLTIYAQNSGSTVVDVGTGTLTLNGNISLLNTTAAAGNQYGATVAAGAGGTLNLGGSVRNITLAGQNISQDELVINAIIANGGINFTGNPSTFNSSAAGLNLGASTANTYTLGTMVNAGTLNVAATTTLGAASGALTLNTTGAVASTVILNSSQTIGSLQTGALGAGAATVNLNGAGVTLTVNQSSTTTYGGVISGAGSLTKSGAGALTLTGANTYTGSTTISAGTIQSGRTNALSTGSLDIAAPGTFNLAGFNQTASALTGSGAVTLNGGVLTVGSGNFGGAIAGAGALVKNGPGTLSLTAASTYSSGMTINQGTVQVTLDTALGSGSIAFTPFAILAYSANNTTSRTFSLNNGELTTTGAAVLTFNNAVVGGGFLSGTFATQAGSSNTFSGGTLNVSGGLTLNGSDSFSNYTLNGTTSVPATRTATFAAVTLGASGSLTVGGTVNASEFLSYGTLTLNAGATLNNSVINMTLGGGSQTFVGSVGSPGGLINIGGGGLQLRVNGGLLVNNGSVGFGQVVVGFGGYVKGAGVFQEVITQNGGIFSPGNSPGTALIGTTHVNGRGILNIDIDAAGTNGTDGIGTTGANPGWGRIKATGELRITATTGNPLTITLTSLQLGGGSGPVYNFDNSTSHQWEVIQMQAGTQLFTTASGGTAVDPSTYVWDPSIVTINTNAFQNSLAGGSFSTSFAVNAVGSYSVYVNFTPTPEPGMVLAIAALGLGLLGYMRRWAVSRPADRGALAS